LPILTFNLECYRFSKLNCVRLCDYFRSVNGADVGADDDLRRELTGFA